MKNYSELSHDERKEITELFATWLGCYTDKVINKVMENKDKIINDDLTMNLLRELKQRTEKENDDFSMSLEHVLYYGNKDNTDRTYHFSVLTHSQSYRDVLYDMYIKDC